MISITCSQTNHLKLSPTFEMLGTVEPNPNDTRPNVKLPDGRTVPYAAYGYTCAPCWKKWGPDLHPEPTAI